MEKNKTKVRIGGQAVLEGVMMRGLSSSALAVRKPEGDILLESRYIKRSKAATVIRKIPIIRGVYNFGESMATGFKDINKSADVAMGVEQAPEVKKGFGERFFSAIAMVLGLVLAIGLFFLLPQFLGGLDVFSFDLNNEMLANFLHNLIMGAFRLLIFVAYIVAVSFLKDIKRLFSYHGAEHKVINCFESGKPLTVKNVMASTRKHPRCGTTFIFVVILIGVLFFSLIPEIDVGNTVLNFVFRFLSRLALLPVVAGIAYEFLIFTARYDNIFFRILRAPGMLMQKLSTNEPDEEMVEVALLSFKAVLAMEAKNDLPLSSFGNTIYPYSYVRQVVEEAMQDYPEDESQWIMAEVLDVGRAELPLTQFVTLADFKQMMVYVNIRKTGMPLQRAFGNTNFCGIEICVDEHTLVPRPETEILVDEVGKYVKSGKSALNLLDLCTGSGAIAIALKKEFGDKLDVTATDISEGALEQARLNARVVNNVDIKFLQGDLFEPLKGKKFDIIVCNPPYIPTGEIARLDTEVKDYDPDLALDGGSDGLDFYRRIAGEIDEYLPLDGIAFFECGKGQSAQVVDLFDKYKTRVINDLAGIERIVVVQKNV